tara:strand:- start:475 stop:1869 length:1395 start_codon:yes stop_codon:yes gene_type:complete
MRVIVCVATESEIPMFIKDNYPALWCRFKHLRSGGTIDFNEIPLLFVVVGVGVLASDSVSWLIHHFEPDEIINIGTAGSTVFPIGNCLHINAITNGYETISLKTCSSLPNSYQCINKASCFTVDQFDRSLTHESIDMEAYHIASTCQRLSIHCSVFKFVTDRNNDQTTTDYTQNLVDYHRWCHQFFMPIFNVSYDSISVVVPVYNRPDLCLNAVDSVLSQTRFVNEVLVVDDGSDVVVSIQDDRVSVLRNEINQGVSSSRNKGITHASSEWIAFLDSDDIWSANHLMDLFNYLQEHPMCRWAQSDEHWIRNGCHLNKRQVHEKPDGWGFERSLERCLVSPSAVILHRSIFDDFGVFDESLPVCEDFDLWLRILRYRPIGFCPSKSMTKFAGHGDQLSFSYDAMDKFRLTSLISLFELETDAFFSAVIKRRILVLIDILRKGAIKRDLIDDIEYYQQLESQLFDG